MREIKFRCWDSQEKQWLKDFQVSKNGLALSSPNWKQSVPDGVIQTQFSDERVVLLQYTGLLDKNGTEIYEGDIIEWLTDSEGGRSRMAASYEIEGGRITTMPYINATSEVIGNIMENKELLK